MTLTALEPIDGEAILPLAKLKQRIRVLSDDEDSDIERMRDEAIDFVERYSGTALQQRSFAQADNQFCRWIKLLAGPIGEVTAVTYRDTAGAEIALTSTDWSYGDGYLSAAAGRPWPNASGKPGAVSITFTAGLENAETEAPMLIAAVAVAVAAMRDNREAPDFTTAMRCADQFRAPGL